MKILIFSLILIILAVFIFYFKPFQSETTLQKVNNKAETNVQSIQLEEHQPPITSSMPRATNLATVSNNGDYATFDTKSDLSIQPIDPEKDPANQIVNQ